MIFEAVILFSDTFKRDGEMSQKDDEEMCKILSLMKQLSIMYTKKKLKNIDKKEI